MKTIYIILLIIWLLLGLIAVWRTYQGWKKNFYIKFNDKNLEKSLIIMLLITSPVLIIGGLITLVVHELIYEYQTWYFKIPKDENSN